MKNIPEDVKEFLRLDPPRTFEFDSGELARVVFKTVESLSISSYDVNSYELFLNGELDEDPVEIMDFEGVSLLSEVEGYEANGVLVWFTTLQAFGAWDSDHHQIMIFDDVDWPKIELCLIHFLNAQWYPNSIPHRKLNPWKTANEV